MVFHHILDNSLYWLVPVSSKVRSDVATESSMQLVILTRQIHSRMDFPFFLMSCKDCELAAEKSSELQDPVRGFENFLGFLDHCQRGIHLQTFAVI